jgi:thymidylate synthase (FAD)
MIAPEYEVKVLDQGFVRYLYHAGDDLSVVNAARVSFSKRSTLDENGFLRIKDVKLIHYLADHNHWTPFAHNSITLHIKAPIFVRTQLFKHKVGFTENEESRRYVKHTPSFYMPKWRTLPPDNAKQGSGDFLNDKNTICELNDRMKKLIELSISNYDFATKFVAAEQARAFLPQNMYTEWLWTGSLAGYARVFNLRSDSHSQWETQEYAAALSHICSQLFPESWLALTKKTMENE